MSELSKRLKQNIDLTHLNKSERLSLKKQYSQKATELFNRVVCELEALKADIPQIDYSLSEQLGSDVPGGHQKAECLINGHFAFNVYANSSGGVTFGSRDEKIGKVGIRKTRKCKSFEQAEALMEQYISPKLKSL